MSEIQVGQIKLHFVEEGAGSPLFMLHGNAGSWRVWRKVIPSLGKHYRVFAHDRQGFGDSDKSEIGQFGPRDYAGELARLMDALEIDKAHVCGISFGGMVAQCFGLDFPDRTSGLILVGTTPDRTGRSVPETLTELERDGWPAVADRLIHSWFRPESGPEDIAEAYEIALQSSQKMRELTVKALGSFDVRREISGIRAPTLVITGKQDVTCPPSWGELMQKEIPGARLVLVDGSAHLVPVEQPQAFLNQVIPFLAEVDAQSSGE